MKRDWALIGSYAVITWFVIMAVVLFSAIAVDVVIQLVRRW